MSYSKALNIPFRHYGLSIGNSSFFNGLRINFSDRFVNRINGINITFWPDRSQSFKKWYNNEAEYFSQINGISLGLLPLAGSMNFINIGLAGIAATPGSLSGISSGGLFTAAVRINGISVSGLLTQANTISGLAISGLLLGGTRDINGLAVAGLAVSSDVSDINGVAVSPGIIYCDGILNGVGIAGLYLKSNKVNGLAMGVFSWSDKLRGVSIAVMNKTKQLHGLQIGLINYAANNRKIFRAMPLVNMNFRKTKSASVALNNPLNRD